MNNAPWLRWLAIAAVALIAIFFRIDGLADSPVWYDEAISALRVTGHTEQEALNFASSRNFIQIAELHRFMEADPAKNLGDTMHSLITEDAQHTPAYYVLAHYWASWIGTGAGTSRIPAVVFSLLVLPAIFWLCRELFVYPGTFSSDAVCWAAVLIATVSPYQIGFAREHREYSMWILAVILLAASFFRALRLDTRAEWLLFAAALIFSTYVHLLSWLVWAVLAITILVRERSMLSPRVRAFALASIAAGALFVPWAIIILQNRHAIQQDLSWVSKLASPERFNIFPAVVPHFRIADIMFFDVLTPVEGMPGNLPIKLFGNLYPFGLLVAAIAFASRLRRDTLVFLALLLSVITLPTLVADFISGGSLGWVFRYAAPTAIGWELLAAFVFACFLSANDRWQSLRFAAIGAFLAVSAYGAYIDATGFNFPKRPNDRGFVAEYLNLNGGVSLLTDDYIGSILSLSRQTRPDLQILARPRCLSCPDTRKIVDIPETPGLSPETGKLIFYRSWMNIGHKTIRQPLQDSLGNDQFGDPRFHTKTVEVEGSSVFLYKLEPK